MHWSTCSGARKNCLKGMSAFIALSRAGFEQIEKLGIFPEEFLDRKHKAAVPYKTFRVAPNYRISVASQQTPQRLHIRNLNGSNGRSALVWEVQGVGL